MHIAHTIAELRQLLAGRERPAFVPTMGNLHAGHIALVRQATGLAGTTVASGATLALQGGITIGAEDLEFP